MSCISYLYLGNWTAFVTSIALLLNSLAPGRRGCNFESILREHMSRAYCEIAFMWMPENPYDDKSTLVQGRQHAITWLNVDPDLCHQMALLISHRHIWMLIPSFGDHDDVIKWKRNPRYWPFVLGIHRSPVNSPHKGQWRGALMFCLICAWINGWVNNGEAGDLRRHRAHYDVTLMDM